LANKWLGKKNTAIKKTIGEIAPKKGYSHFKNAITDCLVFGPATFRPMNSEP
jgi:hypothetical protein